MSNSKNTKSELNIEILVGFVNSFSFTEQKAAEALGGHPKVGRLYQIIKDKRYGYRIHIGAENNPSGMAGILLGEDLVGSYDGKWDYNVAIVTKDNFLNFDIKEEDAVKLGQWFDTDNADLRKILGEPIHLVATNEDGDFTEPMLDGRTLPEIELAIDEFENEEQRYKQFTRDINTIMQKDEELFEILIDVVSYLTSTYSDKYEENDFGINAKEFLLSSASSDVALFNAFKYLKRYSTTGFTKSYQQKDLLKAIHYILFELQRRNRQDEE